MLGNGVDAGSATVPLDQIDRAIGQIEEAINRLNVERGIIAALSYETEDAIAGHQLAVQDAQVSHDLASAEGHRSELHDLRRQTFHETPGGGMLFGLGQVVVLAGAAVLAAVVAWVAYVVNAMDSRRAERQSIRESLVAQGKAPASILQEEPGIIAGISGVIGKTGWIIGGLMALWLWGNRGKRYA